MMWVAAFTVLGASLIAMTRDNLKARLAYSTVSQLSYIVLGATMASSFGILSGGMQNHSACSKGGTRWWAASSSRSDFGGLARRAGRSSWPERAAASSCCAPRPRGRQQHVIGEA